MLSESEDRERSRPVFVLCSARSGSTLLRYALDAHPSITCPGELNLGEVFAAVAKVYSLLQATERTTDPVKLPADAKAWSRDFAESTIGAIARKHGKQYWVDKSLVNAMLASLIYDVFPDGKYLCVVRECADFIISAHEASPWGFGGYGFEPYAGTSPANSVLAMARYWLDQTEAAWNFHEAHREVSHLVRYEELVCEPESTLRKINRFLELDDQRIPGTAEIFDTESRMGGAQDHKISYTSRFDPSSIGQGWRVPTELLPDELTERIDALAKALGYPPLGGRLEEAVLRDGTTIGTFPRLSKGPSDDRRDAVEAAIRELVLCSPGPKDDGISAMKLLAPDIVSSWVVDFVNRDVRNGEETCCCAVIADAGTLLRILGGELNPAAAVRSGVIRAVGATASESPDAPRRHLDAFLAGLSHVVERRRMAVDQPTQEEVANGNSRNGHRLAHAMRD